MNRMKTRLHPLIALIAATSFGASAEEIPSLDAVIVTAPRMNAPLTVVVDARAPQQPVPANDGAAFLKTTPGFSVIRKGGTDGDPVLRGLAGSRLHILMEGTELLGGCPQRMDPPTAYVFPETFDTVTVIKGPQTASHGNGNLAGVVIFDRDEDKAARPGTRGHASLMGASWGRVDALAGGTHATDKAFIQANVSHAESDDYKDGDGRTVHSTYQRQSLNAKAGWRLGDDSRLTLDAVASRAEAAYADRAMDGSKFDRQGVGIKYEKSNLSPLVERVEAQAYYNHVDHVMDNYSLRARAVAPFNAMNVDRKTRGARVSVDLTPSSSDLVKVGADWQANVHGGRMGMGASADAATQNYLGKPKLKDMETDISGVFAEWHHDLAPRNRLVSGLRLDRWNADRYNNLVNPVAWVRSTDETLTSGFLRYEQDLQNRPATLFIGLGRASRPMDYWEMKTYNGLAPNLAIPPLKPETNTQLDTGLIWKTRDLSASVSLFYSRMDDYLLTASTALGAICSAGMTACAYNVDATRYGGEAELAWRFRPGWTVRAALSLVRADNDSMDVPLAQTPPSEARVGLDYQTGAWNFGGIVRMVDRQDRVHAGYGNIVGQDTGTTPGFATLALNAAYRPNDWMTLSAGIDNVFDKLYAEHLNRIDSVDTGLPTGSRIYEAGRMIWVKMAARFD